MPKKVFGLMDLEKFQPKFPEAAEELKRCWIEISSLKGQIAYDSHYKRMYDEFHKRVNSGLEKHEHDFKHSTCWCGISRCVLS